MSNAVSSVVPQNVNCTNAAVLDWIESARQLLEPDQVVWIDGSEEESQRINELLVGAGTFVKLNEKEYPNSFWSRSNPNDVARVEARTFICSQKEDDCGPTNNWMNPEQMRAKLHGILAGAMRGKTMYVVPYLMGPDGSPFAKVGFELTDSAYVVANMRIMARIGDTALKNLPNDSNDFVKGVHAVADLDPEQRYIVHFPETCEIVSVNTDYGGNALQGKKCFALRIASTQAKREGWMAEHMLILGITDPKGTKKYICAAFPSACGKTNLAMLIPPKRYLDAGWKVETVGDDIAWLNFGEDGRLYAINPENGFFGVAPGTSEKTNPNAIAALKGNTIFTNTALDLETMTPWWEGLTKNPPTKLRDWLGNEWDAESGAKAAHPNSRFTAPAKQCPCISPEFESPRGVPIDAIIFGGRRERTAPLVYEAKNWQHGTFVGVTMASEATAAAAGTIGALKRDPMAMRPFIGYHAGDYFQHWLDMGVKGGDKMPRVYHVNWFKKDSDGNFLWPGFGENMRVLEWIFRRVEGTADGVDSPLGVQPKSNGIPLDGINITQEQMDELLSVSREDWEQELASQADFLASIGPKLPKEIMSEHEALKSRVRTWGVVE
ncbi:MAG: phosphoenolpyruvate carboxykinase (GTP) [Bdellovibrionales bacterium]|nr:phosphoenolpyruvate carboxykinase (GTP) [Bdellovibrionales bacterium]